MRQAKLGRIIYRDERGRFTTPPQPTETKYVKTVYRDERGRFKAAPKGKKVPKGWTKKLETRVRIHPTAHQKWIRQFEKEEAAFEVALKKSRSKLTYEKIKGRTARHLRFNREGEKQYKKISPSWKPRKGYYYRIGIYEDNKRVGYWRTSKTQTWTTALEEDMHREMESIRFPQRKKVEYRFDGDTLREALAKIRIDGLHHNAKVFLNLNFKAIRGPRPEYKKVRGKPVLTNEIKFNQNITVVLNQTFGESYDQILEDKVYQYLREWCNDHNVRYTSHEVLEELYDDDDISIDTYARKLEQDWMTDLVGNVYAHVI